MKIALLLAALLLPVVPAAPKRIVYGWFPSDLNDWSTAALDWSAITHLSFRSVVLKPDGAVDPGYGATPERIKKLVDEAHRHDVKVTVLAWGTNSEGSSSYLAQHQEKVVDGLLAFAKTHNLDGVTMDDETWKKVNSTDQQPNRDRVTAFFRLLRDKFKAARADYHLTWASPGVISPDDRFA